MIVTAVTGALRECLAVELRSSQVVFAEVCGGVWVAGSGALALSAPWLRHFDIAEGISLPRSTVWTTEASTWQTASEKNRRQSWEFDIKPRSFLADASSNNFEEHETIRSAARTDWEICVLRRGAFALRLHAGGEPAHNQGIASAADVENPRLLSMKTPFSFGALNDVPQCLANGACA